MRKKLGIIVILFLTITPLVGWFLIEPLKYRFFGLSGTMTSFGQITGILGLTLYSINLILSARIKILEKFFQGLSNVYNYHRIIGQAAFILLLFHPLFLLVRYLLVSLAAAIEFLTPFKDLAVSYGSISLSLMILLMVLTLYIKLKYHVWKMSHKFMVLVFVFALLHSIFISSDISRDLFLRIYLLGLGFIGLALSFYQAFLSKWLNNDKIYTLKKINILTPQVVELELAARNKKIKFIPGQFIFIRFLSGSVGQETHPFSISSSADDNSLQVVIKSLGDFTEGLKNLQPGIQVAIEGPYGKFSHLNVESKKQVWIAGGVGITPFLSMARSLNSTEYNIDLYYCVNNLAEAVLIDELKEIENNKKIKLIPWCSSEKGYLTAKAISEITDSLTDRDVLICGPAPFMFCLQKQLLDLKVLKKNIHFENFKFL